MRTGIVVEENVLDQTEDLAVELSYAIDDIKDFASRNSNYSKTITIPGTAQNNFIFGHLFQLDVFNTHNPVNQNVGFNYSAAKSAKAEVYLDYMLLFKGVIRVLEIKIKDGFIEYDCSLVGELGGLAYEIEGKRLQDLDFSEYNHKYTLANITDSWNSKKVFNVNGLFVASGGYFEYVFSSIGIPFNVGDTVIITNGLNAGTYTVSAIDNDVTVKIYFTEPIVDQSITAGFEIAYPSGEGYYYPLIDFAGTSVDKINYKYTAFRPAFHVRQYLDKIFAAAGYTYESAFLDGAFFRKLIIPFNNETLSKEATRLLQVSIYSWIGANTSGLLISGWDVNSFPDFTVDNGSSRFTYNKPGSVTAQVTLNAGLIQSQTGSEVWLVLRVNGTDDYGGVGSISGSGAYFLNQTITFSTGDYFEVFAYMTDPNDVPIFYDLWVKVGDGTTGLTVQLALGDDIVANDIIPKNIFQKDFITSIVKMFNLYIYEDRDKNKHLKIEPYINFYDRTTIYDWTHKVDYSQEISIKPLSELTSRAYQYKYRDDSDYYNEKYKKKYNIAYGSYTFDTGYEFVRETQKAEVIFSPTPLVQYTGTDKIISAIYKKNNPTDPEIITGHNIRILVKKNDVPATSWNILELDGITVIGTYTTYPYAGHLDDPITPLLDINFGSPSEFYFTFTGGYLSFNLFNVYWSAYMGEIADKDSKVVRASLRLRAADIQGLDFTKYIFINEQLFRLNKVEDYKVNEDDVTEVELLNVINIDFIIGNAIIIPSIGEFNEDFNEDFNIGG